MRILNFLPYSWEHTNFSVENTLFLLNSYSFLSAVFSTESLEKKGFGKKNEERIDQEARQQQCGVISEGIFEAKI